ncbi:hypothetical protein BV98_001373 [Sphingobium herbicidovorans NBRC 16415]|uniref:Uncharacterized protein n=1 Tax=Sphingobium herbicidovorans (strain ATCC 700291 / DSM 11019 / CCUG 56400 / KCTC 2939 / LMG 18315 / NBRC 16415 / MH) TaxID=1219045 RepID=A0A086PBS4_SPHHM|nr:hypothetical protein [Sphingobium herbicidovorans]KFG90842.1 hypothetical protein BV98_001373 [Sphingobium herbicidovorans NBRC 16415]
MSGAQVQLTRLRMLCPGAELWDGLGTPLVFLPGLRVESSGTVHTVDALLSPASREGYETRLYFSRQLPKALNWSSYALMARSWFAFSWQGIKASQPWLDILGSHLEAVK